MKRKLTSILLALVMVLALLPFGAATAEAATSGSCGSGVTWKLDNGTLTISGKGAMTDFTDENLPPWLDDSESVTKIVVSSGVTHIGDAAFIYCTNAASVSLASSVTEIGEGAFAYCYALESITLPSGLKKIGSMAFFGCVSVTSMRVPASVTEIGEAAFSCCGAMTGFQVDSGNAYYSADGRALFNKDKTRFIEYCAQAHTTYVIPSTVKTIASNSICGWLSMTRVTIPASVTTVEEDAFVSNTKMTTLMVDSGNPYYATDGKALLNKAKTKLIEYCAEGTTTYTVPSTVTAIGDYAFSDTRIYSVTMGDAVTTLGEGAFFNCTGLSSVELSRNIKTIGDGAFYNCTNLYGINVPYKLTAIGYASFYHCVRLTELHLPATLQTIGAAAFYNAGLKHIWFAGSKPTIGDNAFYGVSATAYYPGGDSSWTGMGNYGGSMNWEELLTITGQPTDVTAAIGETAVFTVQAAGDCESYLWYWSSSTTDGTEPCSFTGYNTDTLEVPVKAEYNGAQFYCVLYSQVTEEIVSEWATLYVKTNITTQPKNTSAAVGDTAKFTVKATGAGLKYQWQYYTGSKWANSSMTGAKTATLEVPVTASRNGQQYRCVITDANGNKTYSSAAKLTVKIAITQQPKAATGAVGDTVKFTVKATGAGLTYQWQYKAPGSDKWVNSTAAGAKTNTLEIGVTAARNGQKYRCIVKDANGKQYTSDAAKLTVKIAITQQPQTARAPLGEKVTFTVKATGAGLTYQWQYKAPGSDKWVNSTAAGAKTNTLEIGVTAARNGQKYRCIVKDANGKQYTSDAAWLYVETVITAQPQDVTAAAGDTAVFTVAAQGVGLTYQWQYYTGTKWINSGMTGADTAALSVPATVARNGQKYRCIVKDANGKQYTSDAAWLYVETVITAQPQDVTAAAGDTAVFTVAAQGVGLTYQWQYYTGTKWVNSGMTGADTAALSVPATVARNGQQYRCTVTDANGVKTYSDAAKLTVE